MRRLLIGFCGLAGTLPLGALAAPLLSAVPPTKMTPAASPDYPFLIEQTAGWITSHTRLDGAICGYTGDVHANRIVPYFATYAAIGLLQSSPKAYPQVQAWMQCYVGHLNHPDKYGIPGTIYDYDMVDDEECSRRQKVDSIDAYAATFLSLAWAYWQTGDPGARRFLQGIKQSLDEIGEVMTHPAVRDARDGLTWDLPDDHVKYLMDNAEVYRGLADAASLFGRAFHDPFRCQFYAEAARRAASSIETLLWDNARALTSLPWMNTITPCRLTPREMIVSSGRPRNSSPC